MARVTMRGMAVRGVVGCVPERTVSNDSDYPWFEPAEIRKVTAMAGIKTRHVADADTCTSDLCHAAALRLLDRVGWERESIDGLILVTQTQDYVMPSSSCVLQGRLGLSDHCAAFDVNLGCSAYVYGMWLANSLIQTGACRRILLLTGETPSKFVDPRDRATALLFGDGGSATALEAAASDEDASEAHYVMMTDGRGAGDLIVPGGMFRQRFPEDPSQLCLHMHGAHIFDFTRNRVPPLIQDLLRQSQTRPEDYAYFIFHQANEYLIRFLAGRAGIDLAKIPLSIAQFGNTGAASVPLTLACAGRPPDTRDAYRVMLLGFGVGLSWGGASLRIPADCPVEHFVYEGTSR